MEVVILCGGKGTRLSEETVSKPKPMVEIDGKPILWHIMKYYSQFGYKKFVLALGYKADYIKSYFYNQRFIGNDFKLRMNPDQEPTFFNFSEESDWEITFVDTGIETLKGGRIKRLEKFIDSSQFHLTYGDGLSNVDISKLVDFHKSHGAPATVTAVRPPSRFGEMLIEGDVVKSFDEKPQMHTGYINGGFFVLDKSIMNHLTEDEECDFEFGALQQVAESDELRAFKHDGFWQCMDNIREKDYLNTLAITGKAPWTIWENNK